MLIEIQHTKSSPPPMWEHQQAAVDFASSREGTMLSMAMGTGKSRCAIELLDHEAWGCKVALIVAPLAVCPAWIKQFENYAKRPWRVLMLNKGTTAKRAKLLKQQVDLCRMTGVPLAVVVNYEALTRSIKMYETARSINWCALICDECHKVKGSDGKGQTMTRMYRIAAKIPRRLGLTGTPMPHSPLDVWGQFRVLMPEVFGERYWPFKIRYAQLQNMGAFKKVVGFNRLDELSEIVAKNSYECSSSVLDLLPARHEMIEVELDKETYALYAALQLDFVAEVEGGVITASNALTKLLRLQQITGGVGAAETLEGDIVPTRVGNEKLEALHAILDGTDEPVVVFTRFTADIDGVREICEKSGWSFCELSGKRNQLAEWQEGKGRVLGVQIQAGGVGVDLTRARYCVYYSVNWSLGDYEQSLARVHRPGQTRNVVYYHLIAKDTVDGQVYTALRHKKDIVETVIEQMRAVRGQHAS